MAEAINAAVIGLGSSGRGKVRALLQSPHIHKIIGVEVDETAAQGARGDFGIEVTDGFEETIQRPDVDWVLIATPNHLHAPQAIAAMRAGKAVLCEKPMANTLEDAREMVRVSKETGVFFQIGFECRYSKLYMMLKEKVDGGYIGQVRHIFCLFIVSAYFPRNSWRVKAKTGGNMFGEKLSHYVDLPRWWNGGEVVEIYASKAPNVVPFYEVADNYEVTYMFDNGTVSHLTYMQHAAGTTLDENDDLTAVLADQAKTGHHLRYVVVGTEGVCEASVFDRYFKFYRFHDDGRLWRTKLVETHTWIKDQDHLHFHNGTDQYLDVARRVAEGEPPFTSAEDSLKTTELCFEVEAQAQRRCPDGVALRR